MFPQSIAVNISYANASMASICPWFKCIVRIRLLIKNIYTKITYHKLIQLKMELDCNRTGF